MSIPVGVTGAIVNGDRAAHRIRVVDDRESTGGFLIYEWWDGSDGPNENGAFDAWVATADDVESFLQESGWQIDWRQPGR